MRLQGQGRQTRDLSNEQEMPLSEPHLWNACIFCLDEENGDHPERRRIFQP